jgi:hypothetical protein
MAPKRILGRAILARQLCALFDRLSNCFQRQRFLHRATVSKAFCLVALSQQYCEEP